jgi:hypothetical protein
MTAGGTRGLRWAIAISAAVVAGFMVVDGSRALLVGDYFTPRTGEYAGQLGPWARAVEAVGIAPRSTLMKSLFVLYGGVWLAVIALFLRNARRAWWPMVAAAIGSLWYLPFGTLLSAVQIVLLGILRRRADGPGDGGA